MSLKEGRVWKGGKNSEISQIQDRPPDPKPLKTNNRQLVVDLYIALHDIMNVISINALIPESVSYMQQARDVLMKAQKRKRVYVVEKEEVDHPAHYGGAENPYEVIKVIDAWGLGFSLGNAVKYIARAGKKGDLVQDLKKVLTLRCDSHAQYEIRVYADAMRELVRPIVPVCIEAWEKGE